MNYYNENNAEAAEWLRELIRGNVIAPGIVDERSIIQVKPDELSAYTQCHFFAGIGGWSYALWLAGWPDDKPVWTGSCPCQPFSAAGSWKVDKDKRHLWPAFRAAIAKCRPAICFGEQVAGADGRIWLAGVRTDLEALVYGVGAADLCAAGVGAPHRRQRLFWVAHADGGESGNGKLQRGRQHGQRSQDRRAGLGLADTQSEGWSRVEPELSEGLSQRPRIRRDSATVGLGNAASGGCGERGDAPLAGRGRHPERADWSRFEVIGCRDGKSRRIESGTFPLVNGLPGRVGLLRGYGNAIVPQLAAKFIEAASVAGLR